MKITTYTLKELGGMYFPHSSSRTAYNQLKRWIMLNNNLLNALIKNGYTVGQRYLTPKQVRLVFEHLGEPEEP